jgi:hypothetical protein
MQAMETLNFDYLRAKIADARRRLDEQERALDVVQAMTEGVANSQFSLNKDGSVPASVLSAVAAKTIDRVSDDLMASRPTQKEILKAAIVKLRGSEFNVSMIHEVLIEEGNAFEGNKPKNRITVVLHQLIQEKFVIQTFVGAGKIPHRYRQAGPK